MLWGVSFVTGAIIAVFVAAARMSTYRMLRVSATVFIETLRGIPTLVWLFIVFFGIVQFGFSPTATASAIIALSLSCSVYLAEVYRSGISSVDKQQREATQALGLPRLISMVKIILPQARPIILAGMGTFAIHLLKETALVSLLGVVDIMNIANYLVQQGENGLSVFFAAGLIYMVLCVPIAIVARLLGDIQIKRGGKPAVRNDADSGSQILKTG